MSAVRLQSVNIVAIISGKYTSFKPFGQDVSLRIHKIEETKVVRNSEKVVLSLFETVKLSVLISPRNLYISLKSIKENFLYTFQQFYKYVS